MVLAIALDADVAACVQATSTRRHARLQVELMVSRDELVTSVASLIDEQAVERVAMMRGQML